MRFALFLVLLLAAATANAQPPQEAKAHFDRGVRLLKNEDPRGAIAELTAAYRLAPYSIVKYNLGLAYEQIDDPLGALEAFEAVLAAPGSISEARLTRARKTVEELTAKTATLLVVSEPGARVLIDNVERGAAGAPIRVIAAPLHLQVIKTGFLPFSRTIVVEPRETTRIEALLDPTAVALARLAIDGKLPDVEVIVDGERRGHTPLAQPLVLAPGRHAITLRRDGYLSDVREVTLAPEGTLRLDGDLRIDEAALAWGTSLRLDLREPEAVVTIDGVRHGRYTGPIGLPPGRHVLSVAYGGFHTAQREVTLVKGKERRLEIALEPTPETLADHDAAVALHRGLGWTSVGVGAALAISGALILGFNTDFRNRTDDLAETSIAGCNAGDPMACETASSRELAEDLAEVQAIDGLAIGAMVLGGVAIGVGIATLMTGPDADRYDAAPVEDLVWSPTVELSPTRAVAGVRVAF